MALGGHGAMCPEAVIMPCRTVACYNAFVEGNLPMARALQKDLFAVAPILRGGLTSEGMARAITMTFQDHKCELPMGGHPQARLKEALNYLCIPTSAEVRCPLPPLSGHDRQKVKRAMEDIKKKGLDCCPRVRSAPPCPVPPPEPCNYGTLLPK
jgi:dihydrodipicolinate synthase/N-acetylneuraminate lyase